MGVPAIAFREVGPRDGLQNIKTFLPTEIKANLVEGLSKTSLPYVEITSFVSPKAIPQLSDAAELVDMLTSRGCFDDTRFVALIPNVKGLERALSCGFKKVAVVTAASETFNQKNLRASTQESLARIADIFDLAKKEKLWVRGYVSTAWVCPYEGDVDAKTTVSVVKRLIDMGCNEISIGDTIGSAAPWKVESLMNQLQSTHPSMPFAGHFHDTYGFALANVYAAWRAGVTIFDTSVGGIGGCPYAPGAKGNLATETLIEFARASGQTDLDGLQSDIQALARTLTNSTSTDT